MIDQVTDLFSSCLAVDNALTTDRSISREPDRTALWSFAAASKASNTAMDAQEMENPFAPGTDGGPWHHRHRMTAYFALKFLHVLGAAVLLGTGAGIAFFMVMAHRTGDAATVAGVARTVVVADFLFTATAVVAQPITGVLLAWNLGYALLEGWILLSILLYLLTGAFWLPVVWMQMRMRDFALASARTGEPLPPAYHRLFRLWFAFGFPAFTSVLAIFWLMIAKPAGG
jgi:uncharacterized membrane protein